jgi:hypothetical protein
VRILLALAICLAAHAQIPGQPGLVRGVVVANDPGDLVVRSSLNVAYHYRLDSKTWIEREQERIRVSDLRPGELLEIVSDREPQLIRYARLVHVIPKEIPRKSAFFTDGVRRGGGATADDRTLLTFSGIIARKDGPRLTIRTRFDGEIVVLSGEDTKWITNDEPGQKSLINERVFIRAERTRNNDLEAIEIVQGADLTPNPPL